MHGWTREISRCVCGVIVGRCYRRGAIEEKNEEKEKEKTALRVIGDSSLSKTKMPARRFYAEKKPKGREYILFSTTFR